jgi:hypothetical protein
VMHPLHARQSFNDILMFFWVEDIDFLCTVTNLLASSFLGSFC